VRRRINAAGGMRRIALALAQGAILATPASAWAQEYPGKPVRIIVGFAPGGGTDVTARMLAQKMSDGIGQPVLVENRTGAAGAISVQRVATSPPDGYTLLMMSSSSILQAALTARPQFDIERDLAPVSVVTIGPFVLVVHPSVPVPGVKELVAFARARPGRLEYGSSGVGGTSHLAGELFNLMAKTRLVHVPYKGGAESVVAAASGEVAICFASVTSALPLLRANRLKSLAVTTLVRVSLLPEVPTLDESGLRGYDHSTWFSLLAPAGTPKPAIARLNSELVKAVGAQDVQSALRKTGLEPFSTTPEQMASMIRAEIEKNARLIALAGLKAE
jgi:tripartite-type tricarboxylate transporter receptor subunit TctC